MDTIAARYPDKPVLITSGGWEGIYGYHSYGRHPLDLAVGNGVLVPQTVPVDHLSAIDIADGFDAPVRVHGKSRRIVVGIGAVERIEH